MERSTESIEKVICFIQERPFLFDVSSAELARKFDARNLRKKLVQVSCAIFLTVCHHHKVRELWEGAVDYEWLTFTFKNAEKNTVWQE